MRIIRKLLAGVAIAVALIVSLIVSLQLYYWLCPAALSANVLNLNQRAAALPTKTDNGYRLHGLLAPANLDPLPYGRCPIDAYDTHQREVKAGGTPGPGADDKTAYDAYWAKYSARLEALSRDCQQGGAPLKLPQTLLDNRIQPGVTAEQWQAVASVVPDPVIVSRAETVWAGGPRRLGATFDAPLPGNYPALMQIERWRTARAVQGWRAGERAQAVATWKQSIADWEKSAHDTLIDAMISVAATTQVLLAMQDSAAHAERIDDVVAAAMLAVLEPVEAMPNAIGDSMLAEWQTRSALFRSMPASPSQVGLQATGMLGNVLDRLGAYLFDANDTLNRAARSDLWSTNAVMVAASGHKPPEAPQDLYEIGCPALGDWWAICLPFMRNPLGSTLVAIAVPMYADYGVRVADLRNLAAATRLTVEARRRGVSEAELASFIANAPAGMRDAFSGQPFAYDVGLKQLRVELRAHSTVLGKKEATYRLAL